MTLDVFITPLPLAALLALTGFAFGMAYFALLRRSVELFAAGRGYLIPATLTMARIGAAVILLGLAAKLGAPALLGAFIGFLAARKVALRTKRGAQ